MKVAVIVGTSHSIQRGSRGDSLRKDFKSYLITLCKKHNIKVIAEEINDDAVFLVAKNVCLDLGIDHKIIDPNPSEYDALGIKELDEIDSDIIFKYSDSTSLDALTECESRKRNEHYFPREAEWLKRIQAHDNWPVLVICGADHVESFCGLLSGNEISVITSESNWGT